MKVTKDRPFEPYVLLFKSKYSNTALMCDSPAQEEKVYKALYKLCDDQGYYLSLDEQESEVKNLQDEFDKYKLASESKLPDSLLREAKRHMESTQRQLASEKFMLSYMKDIAAENPNATKKFMNYRSDKDFEYEKIEKLFLEDPDEILNEKSEAEG